MKDLTNELTVFIIRGGENPNYEQCKKNLMNQDCKFKLEEVVNVAPMSKAFNQMIEKCETPFYIQVDFDMTLNSDAISKLYNKMITNKQTNDKVAVVNCLLRDPHLEMDICGVKIYDHSILKNYLYDLSSNSCEKTQMNDFESDGYKLIFDSDVIGVHAEKWNNALIYERYNTLMEKGKEFGYKWIERLPVMLRKKYDKDPSDLNFYALMGCMQSVMVSEIQMQGEKDFNQMKKKEVALMEGYFE